MKASSGGGRGNRRATPRRHIKARADHKEAVPKSLGSEAARSNGSDTTVKSGDAPHLPERVLIELRRGQIPPDAFAAMLDVFGQLPKEGQYDLAVRIINALKIYELRKLFERQQFPLPHEHQKHLKRISTSAKHLLALLGINNANSIARGIDLLGEIDPTARIHPTATLLLTWLYGVAVDRRPATATVGADERLTTLILLLSDLAEAAEQCAFEKSKQYQHGRGGARRAAQITAEVELVQSLIASYAALRSSFPDSGPEPAFDLPLKSFVRSGLRLVDPCLAKLSRITDEAIRAAFNRMHKPKTES